MHRHSKIETCSEVKASLPGDTKKHSKVVTQNIINTTYSSPNHLPTPLIDAPMPPNHLHTPPNLLPSHTTSCPFHTTIHPLHPTNYPSHPIIRSLNLTIC